MKWLIIGIMLVGMGCIALKNNTYPKPCENSPLAFNKKTGLYECVDKTCLYLKKGSTWTKLNQNIKVLTSPFKTKSSLLNNPPQDSIHFVNSKIRNSAPKMLPP